MAVPFRNEKFILCVYLSDHTVVDDLIVECTLPAVYGGWAKLDLYRCHISRIWIDNTSLSPLKAPQSPGSTSQVQWYNFPTCRAEPLPSSPKMASQLFDYLIIVRADGTELGVEV